MLSFETRVIVTSIQVRKNKKIAIRQFFGSIFVVKAVFMRAFNKFIATGILFCFVVTDCLRTAPNLTFAATPTITPVSEISSPLIPAELGTVDESYTGQSGKTFVYIRDAPDSLEAQENIAKMIRHLVERQNVKTVFEEGYEGSVPSDEYFGFIKDPKVK